MCSRTHRLLSVLGRSVLGALVLGGLSLGTAPAGAAQDPLDADYLAIVEALAAGGSASALEQLVALERRVRDADPTGDLERTRKREESLLRRLAKGSPDALLPAIELHTSVVRAHLESGRPRLAVQSRLLVGDLVDRWVATSGRADAAQLGSVLLTRLAAEQIRAHSTGEAMLRRAIELDPSNRIALLGLGRAVEKSARYDEAHAVLEQLVLTAPDDPEGRLRLAVSQRRLGLDGEARAQLVPLLGDSGGPDWLRSLAYQELALTYQQGERWELAIQALDEGLALLPTEQPIAIQLAYVLERARRPREAARILDSVREGPAVSARDRYNEPPGLEELLREMPQSERLESLLDNALPVLRSAVDRFRAKEAGR